MNDQNNKDFEDYYAKRLSWYPLTKTLNHPTRPDGEYLYDSTKAHWETWCECQKLNDARINTLNDAITEDKILESHNRDLFAANKVMREALKAAQVAIYTYEYTGTKDDADKYIKAERLCAESIAFKPGDVMLVEVGTFYRAKGNIWTKFLPSFEVGEIPDQTPLYTIQTKSNTE